MKIIMDIWNWISDAENQKLAGLVGACVAAVLSGIWAVYKHFNPTVSNGKVNNPKSQNEKQLDTIGVVESLSFVKPLTIKEIGCAAKYKSYDADRPPSLEVWFGRKNELQLIDAINFF